MTIAETTTLPAILNNIKTLSDDTEENRNLLLAYIQTKYAERTVIDLLFENPVSTGKSIEMVYSAKWKRIKDGLAENIPLTEHETYQKEVKTTDVFGYDGNGTADDRITTEHTGRNENDDVFGNMEHSFDFYEMYAYYKIIAQDVVRELTTYVFE